MLAGLLAEPIQGVGGAVELAPGYLPAAYEVRTETLRCVLSIRCQCVRLIATRASHSTRVEYEVAANNVRLAHANAGSNFWLAGDS